MATENLIQAELQRAVAALNVGHDPLDYLLTGGRVQTQLVRLVSALRTAIEGKDPKGIREAALHLGDFASALDSVISACDGERQAEPARAALGKILSAADAIEAAA